MKSVRALILLGIVGMLSGCTKNYDDCTCQEQWLRDGIFNYKVNIAQNNVELSGQMSQYHHYEESSYTVYDDHYTIRILRYSGFQSDFLGITFHLSFNNSITNEAFGFELTHIIDNKYFVYQDVPGSTAITDLNFNKDTGRCSGKYEYKSTSSGMDEIYVNGDFSVHLYEKALM